MPLQVQEWLLDLQVGHNLPDPRTILMNATRVRHLKCDESKPSCYRCSSTGRICDGYSSAVKISCSIQPGPRRSKKENRYFELFQHNTILGLMGFDHRSTFWSYMVLQFSQSSPAVLHAALALSALQEHLDRDAMCEAEKLPAFLVRV